MNTAKRLLVALTLVLAVLGPRASAAELNTHIQLKNLNTNFTQSAGSCVLASYAIVANYFTGRPVTDFFEGYCRHFGLTFKDAAEAEQRYATHFDAEWRKRNCKGYEVILDLHAHSQEKCFAEARQVFEGRFYLDSSAHLKEIEQELETREAFLNASYGSSSQGFHSITLLNDGTHLLVRDTNQHGVHPIAGLRKIGNLVDSVLYVRRTTNIH